MLGELAENYGAIHTFADRTALSYVNVGKYSA